MAFRTGSLLYRITAPIALIVSLICAMFSLIGGFGFAYLLPTFAAVLCFATGMALRYSYSSWSRLLSIAGAILCGTVLIRDILEIAGKVPFILLVFPFLSLLFLLCHFLVLFERRPIRDDELSV